MGSIGSIRKPGVSDLDFFRGEFGDGVLAVRKVRSVAYVAYRHADGHVGALVLPVSRHDGWYIYKDQSENMGPYDAEAPDAILDLLSPSDDKYAVEWRAKSRAFNERRRAADRAARAVKAGDVVLFAEPMKFSDGVSRDHFRFVSGSKFRDPYGLPVSIPAWKSREFVVVS